MAIKRIYTDSAATPLVYYKILRVTLIIGVIVNLYQIITLVQTNYTMYQLCYAFINFGLTIACAIGMNIKKWVGVLCFYARMLLGVLDAFVAIGIIVYYGLDDASLLGQAIGQIVGAAVVFFPSYIYFTKRRFLFTPWPRDQITAFQETALPQYTSNKISFCRKCGYKLLDGSVFCNQCGAKITKE